MENKEDKKEYMKKYHQENKAKRKEYFKNYNKEYLKRPEVIKRRRKNYQEHKEELKNYQKEYVARHKKMINKYVRNRRKSNKNFRIISNLRVIFWISLKIYTQTGKLMTSKKYGINYEKIIEYLKPFPEDLSLYHIDHIKPLCSFNFVNEDGSTNLEEIQKAFAPENHQWLTAKENQSKGRKII